MSIKYLTETLPSVFQIWTTFFKMKFIQIQIQIIQTFYDDDETLNVMMKR
jgi:hypothetical protein